MTVSPASSALKSLSRGKLLGFRLFALLFVPLLLLGLAEGALRLLGYGHELRLFVADPQNKGYWVMNRYASARFFTDSLNATIGNTEIFRQQKAPNTFRIFVLGESTTIGYPYMHNGSFHRWLQYRLMHTYPGKHFEVINLSLTAVNSYTVLSFGRELLDYEPDAVLVYAGHNEYYGAMGVGSTSRIGQYPALVKARLALMDFRLVQLLGQGLTSLQQQFSGSRVNVRDTLMKRMAADQQIAFGSQAYARGLRQFHDNLDELCGLLSSHKVPVFLSNLVSNEKDLPPFISAAGDKRYSARYQFEKARQAYAAGAFAQASHRYGRARDLDLLRFRAPAAMNQIIAKLARKHAGVFLVDSRALFVRHSPHGIPGQETLLEHVHPNLFGYGLLSEAFYQAMKQQRVLAPAGSRELSLAQLQRQMPLTLVDSLKGAYDVQLLKQGWPFLQKLPAGFMAGSSVAEKLAAALTRRQISWNQAMAQLMDHYLEQDNVAGARRVAEAVLLEYPTDPAFYVVAARLSRQLQDQDKALHYLEKAYALQPGPALARELMLLHLELDQPEKAGFYLDRVMQQGSAGLVPLKGLLLQLVQLKARLQTDSTNAYLLEQVARSYQQLGHQQLAARYLDKKPPGALR